MAKSAKSAKSNGFAASCQPSAFSRPNGVRRGTDHRFLWSMILPLSLTRPAIALDLPAGTPIEIRLKAKLSTQPSKPKDPVEAVVIAPVMAGDQFVIPAGATV